jgi:hypothetical protein
MKTTSFIVLSGLLAFGLLSDQGAYAQSATDAPGYLRFNFESVKPRDFQPFASSDLVDPETGAPLSEDDIVLVERNGEFEALYVGDVLKNLNAFEKALNEIGQTIRDGTPTAVISRVANPDIWLRQIRGSTDMDLDKLAENFQINAAECGSLSAEKLGVNPRTGKRYTEDDSLVLGGKRLKVKDIVPKLNQQEIAFCGVGLTLFDQLGGEDLLAGILQKRDQLMQELGLSDDNPLFQMSQWVSSESFAEASQRLESLKKALEEPSPARLYKLALENRDLLPPELQLPAIPSFPQPALEKRLDLKLKKSYNWPGFVVGDPKSVSVNALGGAELRSGRTENPGEPVFQEQFFQAYVESNLKIFDVLNTKVFYAGLNAEMSSRGGNGIAKFCILGPCVTKEAASENFEIRESNDRAAYKEWTEAYAQQFMVGPVPVVLRVGGAYTGQLGWTLGLNLLSVGGTGTAKMKASAFGEAAIGIQDFIEAGAGGEVALLDVTAVLRGQAGVEFRGSGYPVVEGNLTGDSVINALNGRLYGYAMVDPLGPFGEVLNRIIDDIKNIGDAAQGVLKQISAISPQAAKIVEDFGKRLGDQVAGGVKSVAKKIKVRCCSISPGLSAPKVSITGTRVRYEVDLVNWEAFKQNRRFLNYRLLVGPDGRKVEGDSEHFDNAAASSLAETLDLEARKQKVAEIANENQRKTALLLTELDAFIKSEESASASGLGLAFEQRMQDLELKKAEAIEAAL